MSLIYFPASKVRLDVQSNRTVGDEETGKVLDDLFRENYEAAMATFMDDFMKKGMLYLQRRAEQTYFTQNRPLLIELSDLG